MTSIYPHFMPIYMFPNASNTAEKEDFSQKNFRIDLQIQSFRPNDVEIDVRIFFSR